MSDGKLQKMQLVGYSDRKFGKKTGDTYTALINPEGYSLNYGTEHNPKSAQGSGEELRSFNKRSPQNINFKFVFDGTGVVQATGGPRDVSQDIATFKRVVYDIIPATHQPPYVQLQWGKLIYNCQLTKMTINFKLFKPDGTPIRAEADCTFSGVVDEQKLASVENKQSPDLTHVRIVKDGDTLPLMCYREYGDSKYYFDVARFNKLTDLKNLVTGTKLNFPPLV